MYFFFEEEKWKPVIGYEGIYEVSSLGRVKSLGRMILGNGGTRYWHKEGIMVPQKTYKGYTRVILSHDGEWHTTQVHRIVAMAFIPNPNGYPEINHKNEVKDDNRACNLEWCTTMYNNHYGTRIERARAHSKTRALIAIRLIDGKEFYFNSRIEAIRQGFSPWKIGCRENRYFKGGNSDSKYLEYYWKYADDPNPAPQIIDIRKSVIARNDNGDVVLLFDSLHDAQRLKYYRNSIKDSIKAHRTYKGLWWEFK